MQASSVNSSRIKKDKIFYFFYGYFEGGYIYFVLMSTKGSDLKAPTASVIIPCFNAEETLGEQLDALIAQTGDVPFELILVDNDSCDGTVALGLSYRDRLPGLQIISAVEKKGAGYARNVGVAEAQTEKILFCDADDVVSAGWVKSMADALDHAQVVGGGRDFLQLNPLWHPLVRRNGAQADATEICDVHYFGKMNIATVGAGNLGINRSLFLEIGGFDPDLPAHEDVDLQVRAWRAGHHLQLCPEGLAYIRVRQSSGSVFRQACFWGFWDVAVLKKYRKHQGWRQLARAVVQWKKLVVRFFGMRDADKRKEFVYILGWKCGRIIGSFRFLVFAP